jgi:hypothetical protein
MSNLANMPPFGLKQPKAKPDPAYLASVRELPCCICQAFGEPQLSPTAAHHVIHGRYGQRKTPDCMAIPLCEGHHQGGFDTSKTAIHREPAKWKRLYGPDTDYVLPTQDALAAQG